MLRSDTEKSKKKLKALLIILAVSWGVIILLLNGLIESDARRVELLNTMEKCECEVP